MDGGCVEKKVEGNLVVLSDHVGDHLDDTKTAVSAEIPSEKVEEVGSVSKQPMCTRCLELPVESETLNPKHDSKRSLTAEMRKKFSCNTCHKTFKTNDLLNIHMRMHTGGVFYTCDFCKKTFQSKSYLKMHLRVHTGERPYACEICKKSFKQKCYLRLHMRVHTGERPYQCYICKAYFKWKSYLTQHLSKCILSTMDK